MDATSVASTLGAFTGANFDVVNTLNNELNNKKEKIIRLKEELEQVRKQHEDQITNLVKTYGDRYSELQVKEYFSSG